MLFATTAVRGDPQSVDGVKDPKLKRFDLRGQV